MIAQARLLREFAGYSQQRRTRVEPDREPVTADTPGDFASDNTATAPDVKDALAGRDVE